MEFIEFKWVYKDYDAEWEKVLYYRCRKPLVDASGCFCGWSDWGDWNMVYYEE